MEYIMGIDPGNEYTAYCIIDEQFNPCQFGKIENAAMRDKLMLSKAAYGESCEYAIERVASYGMSVGKSVFETCEWIGRFAEILHNRTIGYVYRIEEKQHICHDSRAKDANIRRALIDRFAKHDLKNGRGTKDNPDFFYGFHADIWSAFAVAITYAERENKMANKAVSDNV